MRPPALSTRVAPPRAEIRRGVWLDARLAVWLADLRLLVVADPHWGYAASHRARGNLLPWWGDDEIARRLAALIADYQPGELILLGDVVHAAEGAAAAERFTASAPCPVTAIAGNHDRRWRGAGGEHVTRGPFFLHHGDAARAGADGALEIVGHHHPAAQWRDGAGTRLKLPALVAGERRLILPAFSPWSAGTPWNDRLRPDETLWAIAPARIFPLFPGDPSANAAS
jgi:metallophosphoesterase superfamily enzyme